MSEVFSILAQRIRDFTASNPYPAKADCDQWMATNSNIGLASNPYPAKADCDFHKIATFFKENGFQPISSESGLRQRFTFILVFVLVIFQPISSESGLRRNWLNWLVKGLTLPTHIQRKRIATSEKESSAHALPSSNPYPAKADCDGN